MIIIGSFSSFDTVTIVSANGVLVDLRSSSSSAPRWIAHTSKQSRLAHKWTRWLNAFFLFVPTLPVLEKWKIIFI